MFHPSRATDSLLPVHRLGRRGSMWSRFRLIAAGVFMAGVAVVYGHDLVRDADYHWPVSIYPMYSDLRRSDLPLTLFQLYGVSGDGREVPIADVPPMDRSRLTAALAGMSPDARLAA